MKRLMLLAAFIVGVVALAENVDFVNSPRPQWFQQGAYFGTTTPNGTVSANQPLVVFGGMLFNGDAGIANNLGVTGNLAVAGNAVITGNTTMSSGATASSSLAVAGAFTATSALNRGSAALVDAGTGLPTLTANVSASSICVCQDTTGFFKCKAPVSASVMTCTCESGATTDTVSYLCH